MSEQDAEMFGDDWGGAAKRLGSKVFKSEKEQMAFEIGFAGGCVHVREKVLKWFRKKIAEQEPDPQTSEGK